MVNEYYLDSLTNKARYKNVLGPFTKKEFERKKKELNVPEDLKLEELISSD